MKNRDIYEKLFDVAVVYLIDDPVNFINIRYDSDCKGIAIDGKNNGIEVTFSLNIITNDSMFSRDDSNIWRKCEYITADADNTDGSLDIIVDSNTHRINKEFATTIIPMDDPLVVSLFYRLEMMAL